MAEHQFVAVWDCEGLEYLEDVTVAEQARTWAALKGEHPTVRLANLNHLKLRAQANPQRHYEIYFFNAADGITRDDVVGMFEASPQTAADTIRRIGHCFYSNRRDPERVKIV